MKNSDFYAFCRESRKSENDPQKRAVLHDVYNYMRECGVSKAGVTGFIDHLIREDPLRTVACQWLRAMFTGESL